MSLHIGADLGGTKLSAVVRDELGHVVHTKWMAHEVGDYTSVLSAIRVVVDDCLAYADIRAQRIDGLGLAVAGWLSRDRSVLMWGANIATRDVQLRADLQRLLGLPVVIDNDGNTTALAEQRLGAGRGARMLVLLTMGTGMGGGIVMDGRVLLGGNGIGGELGHISVAHPGETCICGGVGCAELYTSGQGLVHRYQIAVAARRGHRGGVAPTLTSSAQIVSAATAGEPLGLSVIHDAGRALAQVVRTVGPVLDPDLILIGGTVGLAAGEMLIPVITAELLRQRPCSAVAPPPHIALAQLGPEAGAIGAALLAKEALDCHHDSTLIKTQEGEIYS